MGNPRDKKPKPDGVPPRKDELRPPEDTDSDDQTLVDGDLLKELLAAKLPDDEQEHVVVTPASDTEPEAEPPTNTTPPPPAPPPPPPEPPAPEPEPEPEPDPDDTKDFTHPTATDVLHDPFALPPDESAPLLSAPPPPREPTATHIPPPLEPEPEPPPTATETDLAPTPTVTPFDEPVPETAADPELPTATDVLHDPFALPGAIPETDSGAGPQSVDETATHAHDATSTHLDLGDLGSSTHTDFRPDLFDELAGETQTEFKPSADDTATVGPPDSTATVVPPDSTQTVGARGDGATDTGVSRPPADHTDAAALPPGAVDLPPSTDTAAPLFPVAEAFKPEPEEETTKPAPKPRARRHRQAKKRRAKLLSRLPLGKWTAAVKARWTTLAEKWRATKPKSHTPPELKQERTTDWWRRTTVELAVLYGIIVPIELAVSKGSIGSFGVHPHPYWLIILPMAGARGVVAGLLAAGIGSLLYVLGAIQALGTADSATLFTYRTMLEPILFFAVGFFAGELHDELDLRYRKLKQLLKDVQERNTRLRQERDVLSEANKELEKRIVDDSVQFGNLIVAATRIEKAGRSEVFDIALDLVDEHCGASASVMILLDDGSLDHLCHIGWDDDEVSERLAVARGSEYIQRAIRTGAIINGFSSEETPPEKGPLVVAPLFDNSGVTKAVLCLDEIPLARLNESTISIFMGIAEWVSASLARLSGSGEAAAPQRPVAPVSAGLADAWLGSAQELGARLRLEVERCTRYGVPTSFLAVHANEWTDTDRESLDVVDHFVLTHFTGGMRPSDGLFQFGYPGCYLLVLAGTSIEGAEVVRRRLLRRIEYSASQTVGTVEIFAMGPDAESPDLLSLIEKVAERFRRASALPLESRCPVVVPETVLEGGIEEFIRRLRLETSLATRNGFDLHIVGITAAGATNEQDGLLARHVREAGGRTLRPTDGVYSIGPSHCSLILPCTDPEQAGVAAHRVVTAVRERDPDAPYGALETQIMTLGANYPDASSFLAALARSRRKGTA